MKVETVFLEDKEEYVVVDTIEINTIKYIFLAKLEEIETMDMPIPVVRKLDQNEKNILKLDTEDEYKMALEAYVIKWKNVNS